MCITGLYLLIIIINWRNNKIDQKIDELLSEQEKIAIEFGLDYYNYGIVLEKNSEQLPAIQAGDGQLGERWLPQEHSCSL